MGKTPRVLVGTPIYEGKHYAFKKWWDKVQQLTYPELDILIVDNTNDNGNYASKLRRIVGNKAKVIRVKRLENTRDTLSYAQNYIRKYVADHDYDYWFSLESDIILERPDTIEQLMMHGKPVMGGLYEIGFEDKGTRRYCIFLKHKYDNGSMGTRVITNDEYLQLKNTPQGLVQVHGMGVGCALIRREIVDRFPFWTDERFDNKHSDVYWYMDLDLKKVPVFVDCSVRADHLNSDWGKVEDR